MIPPIATQARTSQASSPRNPLRSSCGAVAHAALRNDRNIISPKVVTVKPPISNHVGYMPAPIRNFSDHLRRELWNLVPPKPAAGPSFPSQKPPLTATPRGHKLAPRANFFGLPSQQYARRASMWLRAFAA